MSDATETPRSGIVPRHVRIDVIGGVMVMCIAGLIWYGAIGLEVGELARFGSGALPKGLAILLFVGGCGVLAKGLMQREEDAERVKFVLQPPAIVVLAMLTFGFFIRGGNFGLISTPQLGITIVGPLTVFIAGCAVHNIRVGELLVTAFGLTAFLILIFADVLGVGIPVFPKILEAAMSNLFGTDIAVRLAYCLYGVLAAALYTVIFGSGGQRRG